MKYDASVDRRLIMVILLSKDKSIEFSVVRPSHLQVLSKFVEVEVVVCSIENNFSDN
jgi:hypothetical protein